MQCVILQIRGLAWISSNTSGLSTDSIPDIYSYRESRSFIDGLRIYSQMFGPSNISFNYLQYKFILFDNVVGNNITGYRIAMVEGTSINCGDESFIAY
jgi:hypothetical protein